MKTAIGIIVTATLLADVTSARAQNLEGTLKKVKETGAITIGHRDSSIPLSYLDDKLQPIGFSIELCKHVVEAVKAKLALRERPRVGRRPRSTSRRCRSRGCLPSSRLSPSRD